MTTSRANCLYLQIAKMTSSSLAYPVTLPFHSCKTTTEIDYSRIGWNEICSPFFQENLNLQDLPGSGAIALSPSLNLDHVCHEAPPPINLDCLLDASYHDSTN